MSTRETSSTVTDLIAACQACPWTTTAPNGLGNAARHHDATGHVVTVHVTRHITYGDPSTPPPGQEAFELEAGV